MLVCYIWCVLVFVKNCGKVVGFILCLVYNLCMVGFGLFKCLSGFIMCGS